MAGNFYDTNVLAAYLFKEENRFEAAKEALTRKGARGISVITVHEIHHLSLKFGVEKRFAEIKGTLDSLFRVIPLDQRACLRASEFRKLGLPEVDALIFATAVTNGFNEFYTFDGDFEDLDGRRMSETVVRYLSTPH